MESIEFLFKLALHLFDPWYIFDIKFSDTNKRLDIWIRFEKGSRFECPNCKASDLKVHDTLIRTWRHLNFFEYEAYIHCNVPRVICSRCGVRQIDVPWSRENSHFTLYLESEIVSLAKSMQITQMSAKLKIADKRIWKVIAFHVKDAMNRIDLSKVVNIGVDETSRKKGHKYITVISDLDSGKVLFLCKGKDSSTLKSFFEHLKEHNGNPKNIKFVCCDMSQAFIKGINEMFPQAKIIFDKFHVIKMMNESVDEVRRYEYHLNKILKDTRYIWLKNPSSLTDKQLEILGNLKDMNLKTVRAYNIKLSLQEFYKIEDIDAAKLFFKKWYFWATHSRLGPVISVAKSLKEHMEGIFSYFSNRVTNGLLEGTNSLIQSLKTNARGYKNDENFMIMIYLRLGGLLFNLPTL